MGCVMSACACMGPAGDCPCIRKSKGLPVPIKETYAFPGYWDYLTDDEKKTINDLKLAAVMRSIFDKPTA